MAFKVI